MIKKLIVNLAFALSVCLNANAQILVVASNEEHHAVLVNPNNGQVFAKLPTGRGPHEIAVSPDGEFAYVANSGPQGEPGNTITVLDLKTRAVKTTFDLGSYTQPHDLRVSRDGSLLWVACAPAQKILEIDARSGKILKTWETKQEGGWMLAPTPDDRKIYVANLEGGSISVIDRIAGAVRSLPFRQGAIGIDCSPDGREVWVSSMNENIIAVVDNATGQITATFDSPGKAPVRVKFTPDGKKALVVHSESKELSVFDAAKRRLLTAIKLAESPKVIALSRDGRRAFLTNPSAHKMTVVDLTANQVLDTFPVGKTPDGIAWSDTPLIGKSETPFTTAFVNVNVIPMTREVVLANQTVIIKDGRIAALGPFESTAIPDNAIKIDGRDRYLLPGLADLHIHLRSTDELLSYLAHGVTTVLHLSGAMSGAPDLLNYRAQIARGERLGPTLYLSGPNVDGDPPIWRGVSVAVTTPKEARRVVAEQKRAGYDVIKVYNQLSNEAYTALAEAAKQNNIAVVGHVPRAVGVEGALKAGQVMIAHGEEYFFTYFNCKECGRDRKPDESKIPTIVQATLVAGTAVTPNLSFIAATRRQLDNLESVLADPETKYLRPQVLSMWKSQNPTNRPELEKFDEREKVKYPFVQKLTKALSDAGVLLLLGTDSSAPGLFPGQSAHLELRELVHAGLTPYQALATGTRNAGQFISECVRPTEKFGTIAIGQRADLILLSKNPLENIDNISQLAGVMARGQWLPMAKLQARRDSVAALYKN